MTAEAYEGSKAVPTVLNSYVNVVKVSSRFSFDFLYNKESIFVSSLGLLHRKKSYFSLSDLT